jgi:4-alpha-glucanotransferase
VPEAMQRHNFHRMHILQYELKSDSATALPDPPASCIASINTHDMPPFAGFWAGADINERLECGLISVEERELQLQQRSELREALLTFLRTNHELQQQDSQGVLQACLDHFRDSPCRIIMVALEDLWQEMQSQNIPSTCEESLNWQRKARLSFEELTCNQHVIDCLLQLARGFS